MNSFIYSNDNKRYHTFNYETRQHYNTKVFKVGLNAGFTCPNRDGKCGFGGCAFCNDIGSGDFQGDTHLDLMAQFEHGIQIQQKNGQMLRQLRISKHLQIHMRHLYN